MKNKFVISKAALLTLFVSLLIYSPSSYAAPISFNTALPVAQDEYLIREQLLINQSGVDPSNTNRDRTEVTAVSTLGYGITHQWTVFGTLPYRDITLEQDSNNQRVTRSNSGFGDLTLFARYTAYKKNARAKTFRVAPFLGVVLPTAKVNVSDNVGSLPASTQLSNGALDIFGGVVLTWQELTQQIDTQISYRINNKANGFEAGNILRVDASYQYRLWRSAVTGILPDYLYGVIETNLIHQTKNHINGVEISNSNGKQVFVSPGIQYVTLRWMAEMAVQIPVIQDLNGTALKNNYIFRSSVRYNF